MATKALTRRETVLKALRAAKRGKLVVNGENVKTPGGWVLGTMITDPTVGGTGGLARLRELRTEGFNIEKKRVPGSSVYQYRLAK